MEKTVSTINKSAKKNSDLENPKSQFRVETIEYVSHSVVSKTIIKKPTGIVSMLAFDSGQQLAEKICPFDTFINIIEGNAEIIIGNISNRLKAGESIIIPAHSSHIMKANEKFKILSVIIKSGYE